MSRCGIWSAIVITTFAASLGSFGCTFDPAKGDDFDFGDALSDSGEADVAQEDTGDGESEDTGSPDSTIPPEDTRERGDTSDSDGDASTEPLGACCGEENCETARKSECESIGGTFNAGQTCAEVECVDQSVCCGEYRGAKVCAVTDPDQCTERGGTVKENARSCGDTQCDGVTLAACCRETPRGNVCLNVEQSSCDRLERFTYYPDKSCSDINC